MISVGVDVSKEKSTVCALKPYGEIIIKPWDVQHTESELSKLISVLQELKEEVRVVMESTGAYHLPVLSYLKEKGFFIALINPLEMKLKLPELSISAFLPNSFFLGFSMLYST